MANVRAIPWMQKITSYNGHTNGDFYGWHNGQTVLLNHYKNQSSSKTISGVTFSASGGSSASAWTDAKLFGNGVISSMVNGKDYTTSHYIGHRVQDSDFYNDDYTYVGGSQSSMVRNAIGFSCQHTCSGSFSDSGGNAQAYLQKVGLIYAHPQTFERHVYVADNKVGGDMNINSKYSNKNNYWYCYRLSLTNITTVKDHGLVLMGMAFQFKHGSKASSHTSMCTLKNMRIIVGDGTGLVTTPNRLLMVQHNLTALYDVKNGNPMSISYD